MHPLVGNNLIIRCYLRTLSHPNFLRRRLLGYVWQDDTGDYVPGIPSLLEYVLESPSRHDHGGHKVPEEPPTPLPDPFANGPS